MSPARRMRGWLALAAGLAIAGCAAGPDPYAATSSCALETLAELPVAMVRNVPLVDARIDGGPARMVLDTGASSSVMLADAARRRGMRRDPAGPRTAFGVGGAREAGGVLANTLELGGLRVPPPRFGLGSIAWSLPVPAPDGFLGADVLAHFDVDLDLPDGKIVLYRARFCPSGTPPWTAPHDIVPLVQSPRTALWALPVVLDGRLLAATLDTGAEASAVSSEAAAALGVRAESLAADPAVSAVGFGPAPAVSRAHPFTDLAIGSRHYPGPRLIVVDLPPGAGDMLLGADYLRRHRVWLSFATGRMFVPLQ